MMVWEDILSTAAVGTERQEVVLAPGDGELGRALHRLDPSDREGALLAAVALAALYRRAGFQPALDRQPLPEACAADEVPCCSDEAGQHLALMLEGGFKEVLPEWLVALRKAGRRVPADHLPALLDRGRAEQSLRPLIINVTGNRGCWLATQNDEWRWASGGAAGDTWETGNRHERLFLLRALRETDPERARELLSSTWKSEVARDRLSFLEILLTGLNPSDEPFLSETLQDRSAEVRRMGGEILLRLSSSHLRETVSDKVGSLFSYHKPLLGKARIEVSLPGDPEKWQKENQVQLEVPATGAVSKHLGRKGWWLLHAVGWVPPMSWCRLWSRKPVEVLEAARNSEWKAAIIAGLITAAGRYGDAEWVEAILSDRQLREENLREANANLSELGSHLPAARLEALILDELAREKKGLHVDHPALWLLLEHRQEWSGELSRAVVAGIKERIGGGRKNELMEWQLKAALKQFALYVLPALADELSADWPADADGWWQDAVDEFQSVLRFRRDMLRAILKEGNN
ncbi:MAG TPA: DUF5691 domain-containing protein [Pyrinomonadaceae bacterium]|nr:DUF5691 domain-containing protein [Pyrinomonadaceae bacterium]